MKVGVLTIAIPVVFAQNSGVIEGTTFNTITHAGVPGISIKLATVTDPYRPLRVVVSDAVGAFRIDGLKDGDYVAAVTVSKGFLLAESCLPLCKPFHVSTGSSVVKLQIPVRPGGSLRGRVIDAEGRPASGVRVELFMVHYFSGYEFTTDSEGRFFWDGLEPGTYRLRARPVFAGTSSTQAAKVRSPLPEKQPGGERWICVPTYFPNAIDISSAQHIVISEGAELDGYEIRLRSAPVYCLRGIVLDDEVQPVAGAALRLMSEVGWGPAEAQVTSGKDGIFEFPSVRPGDGRIEAVVKRETHRWVGFTELRMPQRDLQDVVVRIAPPFALKGVLEGVPLTEKKVTEVVVSLHRVDGSVEHSSAATESDGTVHFASVYPGRYRISCRIPIAGYYLKSLQLGTRDVTGEDVELTRESPSLRVILKSNAASVRGTVEDGAWAKVVLIRAGQEGFIPFVSMRVAVCDEKGRFSIDNLRPTVYYAFAFMTDEVPQPYSRSIVPHDTVTETLFTRDLRSQAQTVHLGEGEKATLDLRVTPWHE